MLLKIFKIIHKIKQKMYYIRCYVSKEESEKSETCEGVLFDRGFKYKCNKCPYYSYNEKNRGDSC